MINPLLLLPGLPTLHRFRAFLHRLGAVPEMVGAVPLSVFRDVNLPRIEVVPPVNSPPPGQVDEVWLAGALAACERANLADTCGLVLNLCARLRPHPAWTLVVFWLLEGMTAKLGDTGGVVPGKVICELGDLYCQAGRLTDGLALIERGGRLLGPADPAHARAYKLRELVWLARFRPDEGVRECLRNLSQSGADPVAIEAGLALLGLEHCPPDDTDALVRGSLAIDGLLHKADKIDLAPAIRTRLRALADHLVAETFAGSPLRHVRGRARSRLEQAVHRYREAGDPAGAARALDALGCVCSTLGDHTAARTSFEVSISLEQQLRSFWGLGSALSGLANLFVRTGSPLVALPLYEADVLLLRQLGGMEQRIAGNLRRHLTALLLPSQNPFTNSIPDGNVLSQALRILAEYGSVLGSAGGQGNGPDPHWLMLHGAWQRVAARAATSPELRNDLLASGHDLLERSRGCFHAAGQAEDGARAAVYQAHLLLDRASIGTQRTCDRSWAWHLLEEAEPILWDGTDRTYLELVWAWWHQGAGSPHLVQRHLAAARRAAELNGSQAQVIEVDARLGVHFLGPTGEQNADLVLLPGQPLPVEFRTLDWRGRPLSGYALHASALPLEASDTELRVSPAQSLTNLQGKAVFTLEASGPGTFDLFAGDAQMVHGARVKLHARGCILDDTGLSPPLSGEDRVLLLQLFGPGYTKLKVAREVGGGRSGARVLLVEPFRTDGAGGELKGQVGIVKVGGRWAIRDEWQRHESWVKDILPVNVARCERRLGWGARGALRTGLAGGQDPFRVRELCDWLIGASPFDAHLLLERILVADLAPCWYANGAQREPPRPLAQLYGPMVAPLLTVSDTDPPRGLLARPPAGPFVRPLDALLPRSGRNFAAGDEISLEGLSVVAFQPWGSGWEYELRLPEAPLRVVFRTPLAPEWIDRDGNPEHLLRLDRRWSLRGRVEWVLHDRLLTTLQRCVAEYTTLYPGEKVSLSPDGGRLSVGGREVRVAISHLHGLLERSFPAQRSVIHGDLHGRNVLVGPNGQPFYIDFARTGPGPTLFDFLKFEVYLWHDVFAGWPGGNPPAECSLAAVLTLLEEFSSSDARRRFPSPYALLPTSPSRGDWPGCFRQCLTTLRSAARPYIAAADESDYFLPLCLYTSLMLRWCDPGQATDRRQAARQGVIHALVAGSLLDVIG